MKNSTFLQGDPQFLYVLTFRWKYFFSSKQKKKSEEITKEFCLCKGRFFLYECILLRFKNTLGLMPSGSDPPSVPRENTLISELSLHPFLTPVTKFDGS
jgi:hypothetical protein